MEKILIYGGHEYPIEASKADDLRQRVLDAGGAPFWYETEHGSALSVSLLIAPGVPLAIAPKLAR